VLSASVIEKEIIETKSSFKCNAFNPLSSFADYSEFRARVIEISHLRAVKSSSPVSFFLLSLIPEGNRK
jgi:hypothetical protein